MTRLCFRRKKEEGRRKKEEGRRKKEEGRRNKVCSEDFSPQTFMRTKVLTTNLISIFKGHVTVAKADQM
ncbi:MAG: hypothetical protein EAZ60_04580 [Oscillatoriales cyanobacterium]|uniref:hypothetical protein n=1 Tax=Microcoleus sp. PH2017_22_RUC_O_B TaxID=2798833 RepID=UPI001D67C74E|nr:hypothetical protein [Microcoleus sp. PH2017_22_RUC_O_B]MCC3461444.1 hypothetical protein [Microcoleus sp. PH2017_11_PCY_U_A]MCC3528571.1 hypothetical protein [Microcoleus sp. PH2017_21_RUC_O_A]TAE80861.1 MAG: hypothetical protein EAZ83_17020 [Oscillatoriales cyanobacterium]TAE96778.1 MAG: hypothetical protein EAZ79_13315 [Oscillatoriales cyanobacterium]TAF18369.1 MAG: hypothetical protein EAZ73_18320 [Oscillatoriales cyanobacterium]